ncbi:kinase-like domain-containing protein, partial [Mycena floridula]
MKYLQRNNKTPVEKLDIILGISKGLSYLHSHGLVHGSLATSKILMTDAGVPAIGGYGMSNVLGQIGQTTNMVSSPVRFTAPECFAVEEPAADRQAPGDVYSLSMVMLEIFSGSMPYHDRGSDHAVLLHIVSGGRPDIEAFETVMLPPSLRNIIRRMWNQLPAFRPNIGAVIERLITLKSVGLQGDPAGEQPAELKETEDTYENECKEKIYSSSSGEEASFTDLSELKKTNALDLSGRVRRDGQYPFASGGNSNIYRGKLLRPNGKKIRVAIKMIRLSDDGSGTSEEVIRRLKREASIWSRLVHPNVLPFIGICSDIAPWPVLVSPFYKHGHIQKYLVNHEAADRMAMITAIASGLEYLHSKDVVHGDLKAQNILVDKRGNPSICDFGISKLMGSRGFTTSSVGTAPYMAPELFFVIDAITHNVVLPTTTKSSDVYSFGLLVLEILTGEAPKRRPGRPIINSKEYSGLCPERSDYSTTSVSDKLWETCLMDCWRFEPERRPSMRKIIAGNHFSSSRTIMVSPASVKGRTSASTRVSRSEISLPNDSVHPLRRVRKGFWNRRGDHLDTGAGGIDQIVYAPHDRAYPKELKDYPDEKEGYRDEFGICIKWVERAELEESLPKQGKPPIRPYDSFIEY